MPTDNVYYISGQYGGWCEGKLFNFAIDKNNVEQSKQEYIGRTIRLLFPVIIQDVKNEYVFEFKIEDIIQKKIIYAYIVHSKNLPLYQINKQGLIMKRLHFTNFDLAGFIYWGGVEAFDKLKIGLQLRFERELNNKYAPKPWRYISKSISWDIFHELIIQRLPSYVSRDIHTSLMQELTESLPMSILKIRLEWWRILSTVSNFKISSLLLSTGQTVFYKIWLIHLIFLHYGLLLRKQECSINWGA